MKIFLTSLVLLLSIFASGQKLFKASTGTTYYGFIDTLGHWVIKEKYLKAGAFADGLAPVQTSLNSWTYVDVNGKELPLKLSKAKRFINGRAQAKMDGKYGMLNTKGEWVIKPIYAHIEPYKNGHARAKLDNAWGILDEKGDWFIKPAFAGIDDLNENLAAAKSKEELWGYVDSTGTWRIKPQYTRAEKFSNGRARVELNNEWFFIDHNGNKVGQVTFESLGDFEGGVAKASKRRWGLINENMEWVVNPKYESIKENSKGLFRVATKDGLGYIDASGNVVVRTEFEILKEFKNDLACAREHGKWGYLNRNGEWAIKPTFDYAHTFGGGYGVIRNSGKWYIINKSGTVLSQGKFLKIYPLVDSASDDGEEEVAP